MNETLHQKITAAAHALEGVSETPRLDAEYLFAHALVLPRSRMLARLHDVVNVDIEALLQRRMAHEPIAYILGRWEFFSLEFIVRRPMLVPRPETEHLVECALEYLKGRDSSPVRMLDLCTGSGCVAISIAHNFVHEVRDAIACFASDINPEAIALAQENAALHKVDLNTHLGDLFDALPPGTLPFDLITANPPYVEAGEWERLSPAITRHEDPRALLSGADGLDCLRRIIAQAPQWLKPGAMLAIEMDSLQRDAVESLFNSAGFVTVLAHADLSAKPRIVSGIWPGDAQSR